MNNKGARSKKTVAAHTVEGRFDSCRSLSRELSRKNNNKVSPQAQEPGQKEDFMKAPVVLLYSRPWEMTDEVTKAVRSGVSVQYIMTDTLEPAISDTDKGYAVTKESITVECAETMHEVPGIYEGEFEMKAQGGKNVLHLCGLEFISVLQSAPSPAKK